MKNRDKKYKYVPKRPYCEGAWELSSLLPLAERDFVERIARLFVEQRGKFMANIFYSHHADGTYEAFPDGPRFEVTDLMESLIIATRERDFDKLSIVEHEANSSFSDSPYYVDGLRLRPPTTDQP